MSAFRPARADEAVAIVALWEACGLTRPWNPPLADFERARSGAASDVLVAEDHAGLAATVMVGHEGHRAWVYYLAVREDARRDGWGRAAMAAAEAWARERGMPKIMLMVRPDNLAVARFYEALGYADDSITTLSRWLDPEAEAARREAEA